MRIRLRRCGPSTDEVLCREADIIERRFCAALSLSPAMDMNKPEPPPETFTLLAPVSIAAMLPPCAPASLLPIIRNRGKFCR